MLALFTSRQTFEAAWIEADKPTGMRVSAIFAEASPAVQMELIAALYQRRVGVGVLYGKANADLVPLLERAASRFGLELMLHQVVSSGNAVRELSALSEATTLLALPDATVYTAENVRGILEATYRRGQSVVGFTPSMVKAGTLATAFASIEDVLEDVPGIQAEFELGRVPEPRYPAYWRVVCNESVARSLNIIISDGARQMARKRPGR